MKYCFSGHMEKNHTKVSCTADSIPELRDKFADKLFRIQKHMHDTLVEVTFYKVYTVRIDPPF